MAILLNKRFIVEIDWVFRTRTGRKLAQDQSVGGGLPEFRQEIRPLSQSN
jgi:hypothetical protein